MSDARPHENEPALTPEQRHSCLELVRAVAGLVFSSAREQEFDACIRRSAARIAAGDVDRLRALLEAYDRNAISVVAEECTVPESYFFRINAHFDFLGREIRRRLDTGERVRIWSAGCARGEEAYTAAIVALQAMNGVDSGRVEVLASDVNAAFLRSAVAAQYRPWAFRGVPRELMEEWFERVGELRRPRAAVRRLVKFFSHNLVERNLESWPNAVDVIFCRNVLIYFDLDGALEVADRLSRRLVPDGWLITAPSDPLLLVDSLASDMTPGFVAYRRSTACGRPASPEWNMKPTAPHIAAPSVTSTGTPPLVAFPSPRLREAREAADRNDLDRAEACLKDHLDAFPMDAAALLLVSIVALARGDAERAGQAAERAVHLNGELAMAHVIAAASWARLDYRHRSLRAVQAARESLQRFSSSELVPESGGATAAELHDTVTRLEAAVMRKENLHG